MRYDANTSLQQHLQTYTFVVHIFGCASPVSAQVHESSGNLEPGPLDVTTTGARRIDVTFNGENSAGDGLRREWFGACPAPADIISRLALPRLLLLKTP